MLLGKIPIQLKSRISCPSIDIPRLFRDPCFFFISTSMSESQLWTNVSMLIKKEPELIECSLFCSILEQLFYGTSIRQRRLFERGSNTKVKA